MVDIDLKLFFDEVNHDKLMHLLDKHVEDKSLKKLIGAILRAPVQGPDGSRYKTGGVENSRGAIPVGPSDLEKSRKPPLPHLVQSEKEDPGSS